jgi:hypothetical protein
MENFKSATNISMDGTGKTPGKNKACMLNAGTATNPGFTLDFRSSDGILNSTHIKIGSNTSAFIPSRVYGITGISNSSAVFFN